MFARLAPIKRIQFALIDRTKALHIAPNSALRRASGDFQVYAELALDPKTEGTKQPSP
ncbi:MAG: hypothetical protein ABJP48_09465 [Erythrobacter sp.]